MKFIIDRASNHGNENVQPCNKAIKEKVKVTQRIIFRDLEHFNESYKENMFRDKTLPILETETRPNGQIALLTEKIENLWTIEFNSFEELLSFNKEIGNIILAANDYCEYSHITIYDDYRE